MIYSNTQKQKLMISLDWLQWSGYLIGSGRNDLPEMECPDTYRLELLDGNQVFKYRAVLYDCLGRKMLTMLWKPKSPLIQYNIITFQVANYWFYQIEDVQRVIHLSEQIFIYQFATMTRIDICCDFEMKKQQRRYVLGIYHHKIQCTNKRSGNSWWHKDNGEEFPHDFNFGSFNSSVRWKLYNKSLELKVGEPNEDKPYIIDRWMENGMSKYKVWRLEVSINDFSKFYIRATPTGIKYGTSTEGDKAPIGVKYSPRAMTLDDINDMTIYCIYCDLYEKRFQLRKVRHTRHQNDERVYLIELEKHKITVPYRKEDTTQVDNSNMHNLIKVIESDNAKRNMKMLDSACDALFYYVKFNKLDCLFEATKGQSLESWIREKRALVGPGIIDYLDPYGDD